MITQTINSSVDKTAASPFAITIENIIKPPQQTIPAIGNHGQNGTLKGLGRSGSTFLKINIATQTIINDVNVPKLQREAATFKSRINVPRIPTTPTVIVRT